MSTTHEREPAGCGERPWFLTISGRQFFYDTPEEYPYDLEEIAHALSLQCRFAGHIGSFYSVAQHSALVALTVKRWFAENDDKTVRLIRGDRLESWDPHRTLIRAALLHDAAEAFVVDLPRPMKRLPGFDGYRDLEERIAAAIARRFCNASQVISGDHSFSLFEHPLIKKADRALLATEKRDLRTATQHALKHDPVASDGVDAPASWIERIQPLPPLEAAGVFMSVWRDAGGEA